MNRELHRDIVACLPHLRAFAFLLTRERELADDLVQHTVVRALTFSDQFERGTNFKAWMMAILRNSYFNEMRRRGRAHQLCLEAFPNVGTTSGGQEENLDMRDFTRAFRALPETRREALALVGVSGFSYEDAAKVAGCAVGTMKSRVSRARLQLRQMLEDTEMAGVMKAATGSPHAHGEHKHAGK
ncbi:MAG TPA: sigma-70 family RNA polymerase sigma factor [Alphaproteobacteria bacterium]|nr:sigma-70 family RNA polymerase sigma factor [Alphaproteobacteria bacterium]